MDVSSIVSRWLTFPMCSTFSRYVIQPFFIKKKKNNMFIYITVSDFVLSLHMHLMCILHCCYKKSSGLPTETEDEWGAGCISHCRSHPGTLQLLWQHGRFAKAYPHNHFCANTQTWHFFKVVLVCSTAPISEVKRTHKWLHRQSHSAWRKLDYPLAESLQN